MWKTPPFPQLRDISSSSSWARSLFTSTIFETEHPVVRAHPETGQPTLLPGGFAGQIVGLPFDVSRDLLRVLPAT